MDREACPGRKADVPGLAVAAACWEGRRRGEVLVRDTGQAAEEAQKSEEGSEYPNGDV